MTEPSPYHQIGRFVFLFQHAEAALTELLVLMANADDELVRILINELEYNKRVKTTDVMFARFVDLQSQPDQNAKEKFHKLMAELLRLGERRNDIVHSKYMPWVNVEGAAGLIRKNSKLKASKGLRDVEEEDLLPAAFEMDLERLSVLLKELERFRLKVIHWLYPLE